MDWILIIVLLFWVGTLSSRVGSLEKKLRKGIASEPPLKPSLNEMEVQQPAKVGEAFKPVTEPLTLKPETATDSNILARIGVAALVLGLGFFFKYSIDQGWISEWGRIVMGLAVSGLMVVLGVMWKKQYGARADALAGGGVAVGFFSLYAGYSFYGLYGYDTAMILYVLLAALAVTLAFVKDSRALASIGLVGAFFAPLFFGLHKEQQTFIIVYLTVISLASLSLFFFRQWLEMPVLSLVAAVIVQMAWVLNFSTTDNNLTSWLFSSGLLVIYALGATLNYKYYTSKNQLHPESDSCAAILTFLASLQFFAFTIYLLTGPHLADLRPWAGLMGGAVVLVAYTIIDRFEPRNFNYTATFCAAALLLAAAVWKFPSAQAQTNSALVIAGLGFSVGMMQKREELRVWSLAVIFFALGRSLFSAYAPTDAAFLLNAKFGETLLATCSLGAMAWAYRKLNVSEQEKQLSDKLLVLSVLALWFSVTWDIVNAYSGYQLQNTRNLFISFWWLILAVGTLVMGRSSGTRGLKRLSLFLFAFSIAKVFLYDIWALDVVYRIVAFIVLGAILLTLSFVYNRDKAVITKLFE